MAVLGLLCCALTFSSGGEQELLLLQCVGFSLQQLLIAEPSSRHTGSSSWGTWGEQLWLLGSRAQAHGLAPWNMESSRIRD